MINVLNFPNAYKEVDTILKYVEDDDLKLIPQEFIDAIESNMNKNHEFEYNINLEFEQQNILRETKAIFAYIFLNYWADKEQVKEIKEQFRKDIEQNEKEKSKIYNTSNLFKNKKEATADVDETKVNQTLLVEYKESVFTKLKKFIKSFLCNK